MGVSDVAGWLKQALGHSFRFSESFAPSPQINSNPPTSSQRCSHLSSPLAFSLALGPSLLFSAAHSLSLSGPCSPFQALRRAAWCQSCAPGPGKLRPPPFFTTGSVFGVLQFSLEGSTCLTLQ